MKREQPYATEVALCADFVKALPSSWTAYPESEGWDLLLVREDGCQVGIEAKLKLNADVIVQAVESSRWAVTRPGPDYRAVLVPYSAVQTLEPVAAYVGITVMRQWPALGHRMLPQFQPTLPEPGRAIHPDWFECLPSGRHRLPDYVPDVAAGASAPLQLTKWKICALKIAVLLDVRGFVTRADFKALGIDHRRWIAPGSGWLVPGEGGFVRGPHTPDFKLQHPTVYEKVLADLPKWSASNTEAA